MFQKVFSIARTLLLTGAAILMVPNFSQAQHGGGGHGGGGGGHVGGGGGGHFGGGGAHFGGGGARFGGGHLGGPRDGVSHFRNGRHFGGFGYYPYYDFYDGYDPYYYDSYPYYGSGYADSYGYVAPDSGYDYIPATPPAAGYQALYPPSTASIQPDTAAHVTVKLPADAQLWIEGIPMTLTGTIRRFKSPPLGAGKYKYDIQARWLEGGKELTQTQHVAIAGGIRVEVDFPAQRNAEKNEQQIARTTAGAPIANADSGHSSPGARLESASVHAGTNP